MASTYTPLATANLAGTSSVTFNSFSGYTDLILIINQAATSGGVDATIIFNGVNTNTPYSATYLTANGSTASSVRYGARNNIPISYNGSLGTTFGTTIIQILNYANTTTYKTVLIRANNTQYGLDALVGLWRGSTGSSTDAITSITLSPAGLTWASGSTATLYGIQAA